VQFSGSFGLTWHEAFFSDFSFVFFLGASSAFSSKGHKLVLTNFIFEDACISAET
jgi:hypothetical protein